MRIYEIAAPVLTRTYPLYHGTSMWNLVLMFSEGVIRGSNLGDEEDETAFAEEGVSMSRSFETAHSFGQIKADLDNIALVDMMQEAGIPGHADVREVIIEFDAADIHRNFEVEIERLNDQQKNEQEERVLGDINNPLAHIRKIWINVPDLQKFEQNMRAMVTHTEHGRQHLTGMLTGIARLRASNKIEPWN